MSKMLLGIALVVLELTIPIKEVYLIGLFPDFIGYLLLVFGMKEVSNQTDYYVKNRRFTFWIGVFSLMIYIMNAVGYTARGAFEPLLMQLVVVILQPICLFRIVRGIRQMEQDYDLKLCSTALFITWGCMSILSVLTFVLGFFTNLGELLELLLTTASLIFVGLFFWTTRVYNAACVEVEYEEETEETEE